MLISDLLENSRKSAKKKLDPKNMFLGKWDLFGKQF
jgi:hypothetical protein